MKYLFLGNKEYKKEDDAVFKSIDIPIKKNNIKESINEKM